MLVAITELTGRLHCIIDPLHARVCGLDDALHSPADLYLYPSAILPICYDPHDSSFSPSHSRPRFAFTTNKPSLTPIHSFIYLFAISFISYTDIHDYSRCIDDFFFFFFFGQNMISA